MSGHVSLFPGDPAPWFRQRCTTAHGDYTFDMSGGRVVVLYLFASAADPATRESLAVLGRRRSLFDDRRASFFGVSADATDEAQARVAADLPGIRYFWDADGRVGRLYGARPAQAAAGDTPESLRPESFRPESLRNVWYVLDPLLRIRAIFPDAPGAAAQVAELVDHLLRHPEQTALPAPVLILPGIFEPEFCGRLTAYYDRSASRPSGVFTQLAGGPSQAVSDPNFKRRSDCPVTDRALAEQIQARIIRRVVPEIHKSYQFQATRLERLILACYDARERGGFGAHRDNTVTASEHRRFAVSIALNDEYEGGELVFPEFSELRFRAKAGGAVIFSCSLMHLVTPVTAGRRLACLPFVYDEAAAELKRANRERERARGP